MKKDEIFFLGVLASIAGIGWGSFFEWPQASFFLVGSAFFFAAGVVFRLKNFFVVGVGVLIFFFGATLVLGQGRRISRCPCMLNRFLGPYVSWPILKKRIFFVGLLYGLSTANHGIVRVSMFCGRRRFLFECRPVRAFLLIVIWNDRRIFHRILIIRCFWRKAVSGISA